MSPVPQAFASFLAATLVIIPLPLHWRARNIPTISLIIWLFILNIAHGVNVIAWWGNLELKLLIWCDIVSKLVIGANMALPAACFCLAMRLEGIAAVRNVKTSHFDKRRRMLVDITICFGIPCIYMALHYVVQGHRFDIIEDFGCQPESYVSIPEFFLVWFTPILSCIGTFILGGMAFMHFFRRRATFARHLAVSNSGLTPSRYFRLMTMSLALVIWDLLVFSLTLAYNYRNGLRPWTGWADVHSNWLNVNRFPIVVIPDADRAWLYFVWWTIPTTAYVFFAFFAFSRDVVTEYASVIILVRRYVLRRSLSKGAAPLSDENSTSPYSPRSPKAFEKSRFMNEPKSPLTAASIDYSRLSWPETPSTTVSTNSAGSGQHFDSAKCGPNVAQGVDEDPVPPYPSPSSSGPPSPVIITPPAAAHTNVDHVIHIDPHSHSHQMV